MYMMRLIYIVQRGKTGEVVDCLKILNQIYTGDGSRTERVCRSNGAHGSGDL